MVRRIIVRVSILVVAVPLALILLFRFLPPPATPLMLIRLMEGYGWQRGWMPHDEIAPALAAAVIAAEDNLFCEQWLGFDFNALGEQVDAWSEGDRPRGASTITMQTAKNLFLWPGRDPVRKVLEAWFTPQIALLWPRRRVLEVYLNIVEFGPGIYGAEAAAQHFFGKPAARLSTREAATLAAVLPNPLSWSAGSPGPYVRRRAAVIERRIGQIRPLLGCSW
ncbi:monofunctional biosynthetic peptidoglycan transglycosylase [Roseomonas terrae]|uniref:Biosynthetic peptidoglycan transglycosylase n=2 Tax=Neoroseomonas terrae TaxID=424799 RepID=A0ABS5EGM3_9PROT|nr:monofunctional biosynthetic peptidoglycan transglycosylase [Neoroseomonas terrae]MBR0650174.1 monofunctional biosynthetic peptidoglycan transglycosylase [Neoroseomonas terrae]